MVIMIIRLPSRYLWPFMVLIVSWQSGLKISLHLHFANDDTEEPLFNEFGAQVIVCPN